ncbi:MAG: PilN domain-containing protein [Acidobacteria bacterium]|nr:PilN domain-containing protein [Acidobacteriota bacterium]
MIKINLLGDALAQGPQKKPEGAEPVQVFAEAEAGGRTSLPIAGAIVFILLAGFGGVYWLYLNNEVNKAREEVARLEEEKRKLEPFIKKEAEFRKQREILKKKEEVMQGLKAGQALPVHFLEELANCIPDDVYFNEVTLGPDKKVSIKGVGRTLEVVQLFRQNLSARTRWFKDVVVPKGTGEGRVEFTAYFTLQNNPS